MVSRLSGSARSTSMHWLPARTRSSACSRTRRARCRKTTSPGFSAARCGIGSLAQDDLNRNGRMSEESLDYEDLRRIIELVAAAPHVRDIRLKAAGIEIELHKQRSAPSPGAVQRQPHAGSEKAKRARDGTCVIKSPLVGTFRRAEQQIAQPLVQVGD